MTKDGKIRLAVVGLGMAARPHILALKDLHGSCLEVAGIFTRNSERRDRIASENNWPALSSIEEIAADRTIDAVLLLTPPNARAEFVRLFAGAGKAILMEKPVERTTAAAEALVEIAEQANVPLGIVFQHRLKPAANALRVILAEGRFGKVGQVRLEIPWWRPQSYYDEPGRGTLVRDGGGVLISQAIHALDMMLSLTAPVVEVTALAATTMLHRMETEDFANAGLRFACGAVGSLTATTAAFPGGSETLSIHAEHGSAIIDGGTLRVFWRDGRTETHGSSGGTGGGADPMAFNHGLHRAVIADFVAAVSSRRRPAIDGRSALGVHRLIDAILESSRTGTRIAVRGSEP